MRTRPVAPARGFATAFLVCALALPSLATAQPKRGAPKKAPPAASAPVAAPADAPADAPKAKESGGKDKKEKTFDFTGVNLNGQNRTPQLLYFLERANEELERASLEKRSFIPHMVRSVEEEAL
jgi:hypothetical protein